MVQGGTDALLSEKIDNYRKLVVSETYQLTNEQRSCMWKLMLGVFKVSADEYLTLVGKGRSSWHDKLKKDTDRTFKFDQQFKNKVNESSLIRLLNAFIWSVELQPQQSALSAQSKLFKFTYVQGMNVVAGMFLFVMHELDAFNCFRHFATQYCCTYIQPQLEGVHRGLELLDQSLAVVDPDIWQHFKTHNLVPQMYAFPTIMTLSACTPPLEEAVKLWDFFMAYGPHYNVPASIAQFQLIRNELLACESPMRIVRTMPDLSAACIVSKTLEVASKIPSQMWQEIQRHCYLLAGGPAKQQELTLTVSNATQVVEQQFIEVAEDEEW